MFKSYGDIFRQRADSYHEAMQRWPRAREREFELIVEEGRIAPGEVVCDVPAGGGYLRHALPDGCAAVHFVETAPYFYEHCPEDDRHRRHLCELESLALADRSVDCVLSLAALHHVEDRPAVYREFHRILRPGGRLVVADVAAGSAVAGFLNEFVDAANSMGHEGLFLVDEDRRGLESAGFAIESDRVIDYHWRFADAAEMGAYCRRLFGLDLADETAVAEGARRYLGTVALDGGIGMNWALRFIGARRPERAAA